MKKILRVATVVCTVGVTAVAECGTPVGGATGSNVFRDGDTVVFFGDSITHGGRYHEFVADYYLTRFPEAKIRIVNSGIGGDCANYAMPRVAVDVGEYNPTWVGFHFGMNDIGRGHYSATPTPGALMGMDAAQKSYRSSLAALVKKVRAAAPQARHIYFTPTIYDDTAVPTNMPKGARGWATVNQRGCNVGLALMAGHVLSAAKKDGALGVDWFTPLENFLMKRRAKDPHYMLTGWDRVHPGALGHSIMAWRFLQAQGAPSVVSDVTVDAAGGRAVACTNAVVTEVARTEDSLAFTLAATALPLPVAPEALDAARELWIENSLNRETLRVTGLDAGTWELSIDGEVVGGWTASELAKGVRLGFNPKTPQYRQAQEVFRRRAELSAEERILRNNHSARWFYGIRGAPVDDLKAFADWFEKNEKHKGEGFAAFVPGYLAYWPHYRETRADLASRQEAVRALAHPRPHRYELKRKHETAEAPRWLNVPPMMDGHEEEIAADQRWLYANTVIDGSAFIVTLTPEGDPVFDKAGVYLPQLKRMQKLMKGAKGRFGIQFQATMGHGWIPDSRTPWQKVVDPTGCERYIFCPLGKEFRAYLRDQVSRLAAIHPDFFMVDDDTRFITGRNGCFCPLHLAEMKRRTGRDWTRERLVAALKTDAELARTYDKLLEDSIVEHVKLVRREFDKVDPSIPGMFCCCACDVRHASRIARTVAAPGQRPSLRINNGRYCGEAERTIPAWMHHTALELATADPDVIILDEPDTCPQNRYSMSAADLNCHIALSLLEGCHGAKIWVTRMGQWEPASGVAFRKTLAAHSGLYAALAELAPTWEGVKIPLPAQGYFTLTSYGYIPNWGSCFLGRAGIAYANTKAAFPLAALSGPDAAILTDADIRTLLAGKLLLDGAGAEALTARGFAPLIGCRAEPWSGPLASFEMFADGKTRNNSKPDAVKLVGIDSKATVLSTYHHRKAALARESTPVAPGAIRFRNSLGGDVIVVADRLPQEVDLNSFRYYNETRKRQIIGFLRELGYAAPYYPGDAEILLKWGCAKDGSRVLMALNTGHDALEELSVVFPDGVCPQTVERLGDDGRWSAVDIRKGADGAFVLKSPVAFIEPAVFRLQLSAPRPNASVSSLREGFLNPPNEAKPRVWWHWMNGNVSKDGITADLEAMAKAGIGGAHVFDVGCNVPPGDVAFATPAWDEHLRHAIREAERLGLELTLVNCSGYANAGGPWVAPSNSMFFVTHSETKVKGGTRPAVPLARERKDNGFYRDIAVLAFPEPACEREAPKDVKVENPATNVFVFSSAKRMSLRGVKFSVALNGTWCWDKRMTLRIETSEDGRAWRDAGRQEVLVINAGKSDCDAEKHRSVLVAFDRPVVARQIRFSCVDVRSFAGSDAWPRIVLLEPVFRRALPQLNDRVFRTSAVVRPFAGDSTQDEAIDKSLLLDLTKKLATDGTLDWTAPAGEDWIVLRIGYASNGVQCHPCSKFGGGLEVDKLDASAVRRHLGQYALKYADQKGVASVLCDSYEVGSQNWTHAFERQFEKRRGYSLVPYLAAFSGRVVGSAQETDAALRDYRRTLSDLFCENFAGTMSKACAEHGLTAAIEPYGNGPFDETSYAWHTSLPMTEFWVDPVDGAENYTKPWYCSLARRMSSSAHLRGIPFVDAEGFTAAPDRGGRWLKDPFGLKAYGDLMYACGVTRMVYHRWAHQPWTSPVRLPGMTMGQWGTHFERTETWWPFVGPWLKYQARCQYLLQRGSYAADLLVYAGDDVPMARVDEKALPAMGWDLCGKDALAKLTVKDGKIKCLAATEYAALVVPTNVWVAPESAQRIAALKAQGAKVVSDWRTLGPAEDFKVVDSGRRGNEVLPRAIHRRYDDGREGYFVAWPATNAVTLTCSFRVSGKVPQLWDPETGKITTPRVWRTVGGRTEAELSFKPCGAVFVMFAPKDQTQPPLEKTGSVMKRQPLEGAWTLSFPKGWNCPEKVTLPKLVSWTEIPDGEAKYFSGIAEYAYLGNAHFGEMRPRENGRVILSLGAVKNLAEVTVNGQTFEPLWRPPFEVDITDALRTDGAFDLKIRVANLWPNRLIGDAKKGEDRVWSGKALSEIPAWVREGKPSPTGRLTFTTWRHWYDADPLLTSGLLGPVELRTDVLK